MARFNPSTGNIEPGGGRKIIKQEIDPFIYKSQILGSGKTGDLAYWKDNGTLGSLATSSVGAKTAGAPTNSVSDLTFGGVRTIESSSLGGGGEVVISPAAHLLDISWTYTDGALPAEGFEIKTSDNSSNDTYNYVSPVANTATVTLGDATSYTIRVRAFRIDDDGVKFSSSSSILGSISSGAQSPTGYFVLAGQSGGQTGYGGTGSGDDLTLISTSHATKGDILFGSAARTRMTNVGQINLLATSVTHSTFETTGGFFKPLMWYNNAITYDAVGVFSALYAAPTSTMTGSGGIFNIFYDGQTVLDDGSGRTLSNYVGFGVEPQLSNASGGFNVSLFNSYLSNPNFSMGGTLTSAVGYKSSIGSVTGAVIDFTHFQATGASGVTNQYGFWAIPPLSQGIRDDAGNSSITAASSTVIPLRVVGAAGQSANLQEWRNTSATKLAWVDPNGTFQILDEDTTYTTSKVGVTVNPVVTLTTDSTYLQGYLFSPTLTIDQATPFIPLNVFQSLYTLKNPSGTARNLGSPISFIAQGTHTADTQTVTLPNHWGYVAQPTFSVVNGGTLTVTIDKHFNSGNITVGTGATVTDSYGFYKQNPTSVTGTLTNHYGLYIEDLTAGTNDYGVVIAGADTNVLWLCSGSNPTDEANGIVFGSSKDTNLYRSAANTLKTDDALVASSLTLTTDLAVADGGTGRSSHTAYAVLCGGTTTTAAQQSIASVGTSGQVLTSNGAGALPTFQAAASTQIKMIRKSADTSRNSTVTLADDPHLTLDLDLSSTYIIEGSIQAVSTSATPDIQIGFDVPLSSTMDIGYTTEIESSSLETDGAASLRLPITANQVVNIVITGTIVTSGTDTNTTFMWSQATSSVTDVTVKTGSYLKATKIS